MTRILAQTSYKQTAMLMMVPSVVSPPLSRLTHIFHSLEVYTSQSDRQWDLLRVRARLSPSSRNENVALGKESAVQMVIDVQSLLNLRIRSHD